MKEKRFCEKIRVNNTVPTPCVQRPLLSLCLAYFYLWAVPWMKILVRDINDPLDTILAGKGAINVIDLANIHSCAFIATEDQGEVFANGEFKIHGRIDHSELRGCSLMAL